MKGVAKRGANGAILPKAFANSKCCLNILKMHKMQGFSSKYTFKKYFYISKQKFTFAFQKIIQKTLN